MNRLFDWLRAWDDLVFPPKPLCPFCAREGCLDLGCCRVCLDSLAVKWEAVKMHGYSCYSLLPYQGFARELIHKMKYQNGREIAAAFGILLSRALQEEPSLASVNYLVPVPLHPSRLARRGFNQAALLADNISRGWRRPVFKGVVRAKKTGPQSNLGYNERNFNLRGAFQVLPGFNLRGKRCLIVDDVITSGFTFRALAQVIESYGGKPRGVFLARTEIL
ncbi:MAG: ComF family protein [Firmicutes bacterium]|nr:ComF family protein [Bacillota bacterium]